MSVRIIESCVTCGACLWECPTEAIVAGDPRPVVDEARCTECFGAFGESQCIVVCPADAIRVQAESQEELAQRFRRLFPGAALENTEVWRRVDTAPGQHVARRSTSRDAGDVPLVRDMRQDLADQLLREGLSAVAVLRDPNVIWDRVDGEVVVMSTVTSEFFTLNEVGAFIWDLCGATAGTELLARVCGAFTDTDKSPIIEAVEEFVRFLYAAQLVTLEPACG